jgi:energy-coupling factor transporter ATP-binding protein EcfA2
MPSADVVLAAALARPPTLAAGRLICLDGPAGAGKTTLAAGIAELAPESRVIHMDDLYDGWGGLPRVTDQLDDLLCPLASGHAGSYRRYDWLAGAFAESVEVPPGPLLVLEGVGSGSMRHAELITLLAWVFAPPDLRVRRGLERDGEAAAGHWQQWMIDEAAHHARERTEERAGVLVDGTGLAPAVVL